MFPNMFPKTLALRHHRHVPVDLPVSFVAWTPRDRKRNMPSTRGGVADLTDSEMRAAIAFMAN